MPSATIKLAAYLQNINQNHQQNHLMLQIVMD